MPEKEQKSLLKKKKILVEGRITQINDLKA